MASKLDKIKSDFVEAMNASQRKTSAYDTEAEVVRIEGNTAWVHIAGGVTETPVQLTINAQKGDKVQVRVSNEGAWLMGNATAPPTDDTKANEADKKAAEAKYLAVDAADAAIKADVAAQDAVTSAETARTAAQQAQSDADSAKASAENASEYAARALGNLSTVQNITETLNWITQHGTMTLTTDVALDPTHVYFVVDVSGDYVVGGVTYAVVTEPDVADIGTYYELSIDESLNNYVGTHLALTSEGLWLLPAVSGTNKVLIAHGNGSVYTTAGTYIIDSNDVTVASFRADGVTVGEDASGKSRSELSDDGMKIYRNDSGNDIELAHIGYGRTQIGLAPYYTFGSRAKTSQDYDPSRLYVKGDLCIYNGILQVCIGSTTGAYDQTKWTYSIGSESLAEGRSTIAAYICAHAEGRLSKAIGDSAHAEGYNTKSFGAYTHAEGEGTYAEGRGSHAQNYFTIAKYDYQTVIGQFNQNNSTNAFEIGNGTGVNARSNAFTVDWDGNVNIPRDATYQIDGEPVGERRTLLWTNPNPSASSFASQGVSLPDVWDTYDYIEVLYLASYTVDLDVGQQVIERTPCHAETTASYVTYSNNRWEIWHRGRWWTTHTLLHFADAYYDAIGASGSGVWNGNMIPYKIYGIKA